MSPAAWAQGGDSGGVGGLGITEAVCKARICGSPGGDLWVLRAFPRAGGTCRRPSPGAAEERGRPGCGLGGYRELGLRHVLLASALEWSSFDL